MQTLDYLKLHTKLALRLVNDLRSGQYNQMASCQNCCGDTSFSHQIELVQPIMPSETFDAKVYNIGFASDRVSALVIPPGGIFSFWHVVGDPNCLKASRSIVRNVLKQEKGGGLCQASSIVYHLALMGGLEVLERHNHSVDIYREDERFTPLGTDATVVYGSKDLRIRNNTQGDVRFEVRVEGNQLRGRLHSQCLVCEQSLRIEQTHHTDSITTSICNAAQHVVSVSRYAKMR